MCERPVACDRASQALPRIRLARPGSGDVRGAGQPGSAPSTLGECRFARRWFQRPRRPSSLPSSPPRARRLAVTTSLSSETPMSRPSRDYEAKAARGPCCKSPPGSGVQQRGATSRLKAKLAQAEAIKHESGVPTYRPRGVWTEYDPGGEVAVMRLKGDDPLAGVSGGRVNDEVRRPQSETLRPHRGPGQELRVGATDEEGDEGATSTGISDLPRMQVAAPGVRGLAPRRERRHGEDLPRADDLRLKARGSAMPRGRQASAKSGVRINKRHPVLRSLAVSRLVALSQNVRWRRNRASANPARRRRGHIA